MELHDEPQLRLQVAAVLLCRNVAQQVLVAHAGRQEDVPLVLPRLLVLHAETEVQKDNG